MQQAFHLPLLPWLIVLLLTLAAPFSAHAEIAIPALSQRVTDLTGTLEPQTVSRLENTLAQFESDKGSQITVLLLPTTEPEDIAQFGIRLAEAWKIGREGVDDGIILIVAKDDRRVRIEVGYGLEGVIPDAVAKRIIEEDITPRFKQGDFSGGVEAGVSRMMRLIEGEPLPPPPSTSKGTNLDVFFDQAIFIIIVGSIAGSILGLIFGKGAGSVVGGLGAGVFAWFLSGLLIAGLVVAVIVIVAVLGGGRGGHWSSGGSGGGGWSGGGGFSGGGGGFGGGGASGSW